MDAAGQQLDRSEQPCGMVMLVREMDTLCKNRNVFRYEHNITYIVRTN